MVVYVDGKARRSWSDVIATTLPTPPSNISTATIVQAAIRSGDKIRILGLLTKDLPSNFVQIAQRVSIRLCCSSVFEENWLPEVPRIGARSVTKSVEKCEPQPHTSDF